MSFNPYTVTRIAKITGSELQGNVTDRIIKHLAIDSRKIIAADESLFFAIKGERHNGHQFIPELYKKGVRAFVISEELDHSLFPNATFLITNNTIVALQNLAAYHRLQFEYPVLAITGSNGKTVVKEWLYQLLNADKYIVRSPKSYNSQIGVPISVWQMQEQHELAVFEAGISMPGEMEKLQKILHPTVGIFTNIGEAHAENFNGREEKAEEKAKLFEQVETIIYCKDYPEIETALKNTKAKKFTWSTKQEADLQITGTEKANGTTKLEGRFKNEALAITIPFADSASIENAIHCWAYMLFLGYDNEVIADRMLTLSPVAMRLNLKAGINNCSVINDSYNSDVGSLAIALDFLNQQNQHPKRTVILSDILQSGKNSEELYAQVAEMIDQKGIDRIIGVGKDISMHFKKFHTREKKFYFDTHNFLEDFTHLHFEDEAILLKGARTFGFESIGKLLQQKAHETVLEIDLTAMVHNLNFFRSKLEKDTKIMAMVKAFSYGSGSFEIANLLQFHRVDYLAVAYADEGVELRKAGITLPILVMNPEHQSFELLLKYNLEPELYNLRVLRQFIATLKSSLYSNKLPFPIHIKIDTGMHRLGFEKQHLDEMMELVQDSSAVKVMSVFSHLAASDDPQHDAFTEMQINSLLNMANEIEEKLGYSFLKHIANTSAILRNPKSHLDMVRLGIGLYGIGSQGLQNVSTFKTTISQIKQVPAGESIGYDRKEILKTNSTIATVSIGYADGLSRALGNRHGYMWVNGHQAPIVGNVCMDMCMLDITGIPAEEGDAVLVFGGEMPIEQFAELCSTIPYDILTSVSRRVKRVYYQE